MKEKTMNIQKIPGIVPPFKVTKLLLESEDYFKSKCKELVTAYQEYHVYREPGAIYDSKTKIFIDGYDKEYKLEINDLIGVDNNNNLICIKANRIGS
jgi:hypothetical protein